MFDSLTEFLTSLDSAEGVSSVPLGMGVSVQTSPHTLKCSASSSQRVLLLSSDSGKNFCFVPNVKNRLL